MQPSIGAELAATFRSARRLTFSSGGHTIQKRRAAELAEAILELVDGLLC